VQQVVGTRGRSLGRFFRPRALAVNPKTGVFYVVDRTGRIQRFGADGAPLGEWFLPEYEYGQPVGIAVDLDGSVLVNDSHYHRLLRYSTDGSKLLARWGHKGDGPGEFMFGRDVVVDSEGFIYAGDYGGAKDRIQKFTREGLFLLEWGSCGEEPGQLRRPQGMAVDPYGERETLLVADCANHRVQRFSLEGQWLSSLGSPGRGSGELRYPYAVAVDSRGTVYVCEWGNHRIQCFDRAGRTLGQWGTPGSSPGELAHPWDVEVDPEGRVYVADCDNHRVQIFQPREWRAFEKTAGPLLRRGAPGGGGRNAR
jgi:DNA-binding beta-propeller fold protein YncE